MSILFFNFCQPMLKITKNKHFSKCSAQFPAKKQANVKFKRILYVFKFIFSLLTFNKIKQM